MSTTTAKQVALVTGGTRGIGKAICLDLAQRGFHVLIAGRTAAAGSATDSFADGEPLPGSMEQTRREIEALGGTAGDAVMDLTDNASVEAAADAALAVHGRIDVLVNNAIMSTATMQTSFILDVPMETYQREMQVNFFGPLALTKRVLPSMLDHGSGRIINLSARSFYRNLPPPGRGGPRLGYTASKAALSRLAGSLKGEYGKRGISAFDVDPGPCLTEKADRAMSALGYDASIFAPLTVPACVVGFLASAPVGELPPNGSHVMAQEFAVATGLHAPWRDGIDIPSRAELASFLPVVTGAAET
jgi:NAD(P)-dependent dehydrogenase (short-subunit alcohol dehydrogenase family)